MANFTQQAIKASFMKLLNERPLNKISVRDIVEDCGINRNSFYYHFQDIPTLAAEIITEQTDLLIGTYPSISSLEECFRVAFQFAEQNKNAVSHIYNSVNRDAFERQTMKLCGYAVTTYLATAFPEQTMAEADQQILARFAKCLLFGMCIEWISTGMKEDAYDDLQRMIALCRGVPELIVERSRQPV